MRTLTRALFPALLCAAIAWVVLVQLRADFTAELPSWQLRREPPLRVTLEEVRRGNLPQVVEAFGRVEAEVEVKISAEVSARITELPAQEGQQGRRTMNP
jgi:multidrug efflux pump subunit AcrA (membrane-fusion protein)